MKLKHFLYGVRIMGLFICVIVLSSIAFFSLGVPNYIAFALFCLGIAAALASAWDLAKQMPPIVEVNEDD